MNPGHNKRRVMIIVGLFDTLLGGATLLLYLGILPVDLSGLGLPRWIIGTLGGLWFFSGLAVLMYHLTHTDESE